MVAYVPGRYIASASPVYEHGPFALGTRRLPAALNP